MLLQLGEGNLLLRITEQHAPTPHTAIPLAHAWLRSDEPKNALLQATLALRMPRLTRRAAVEAQVIRAAAHLHDGDELAARHQFSRCVSELTQNFPVLCREIPTETLSALIGLRTEGIEAERPYNLPPQGDHTLAPIVMVRLTAREHDILTQLARGRSPQQIAEAAVVSVQTVRSQIKTLYRKVGAHSAADMVLRACRLGLVTEEDPIPFASGEIDNLLRVRTSFAARSRVKV